jgi:hypothetical protein
MPQSYKYWAHNHRSCIIFVVLRMLKFTLSGDFIPLIQLLKAMHLVQSGGEAQIVVTIEGETRGYC